MPRGGWHARGNAHESHATAQRPQRFGPGSRSGIQGGSEDRGSRCDMGRRRIAADRRIVNCAEASEAPNSCLHVSAVAAPARFLRFVETPCRRPNYVCGLTSRAARISTVRLGPGIHSQPPVRSCSVTPGRNEGRAHTSSVFLRQELIGPISSPILAPDYLARPRVWLEESKRGAFHEQ